jgi:protein SCO1
MTDSPAPPRSGALPVVAVLTVALAAGLGLWASQRVFAPAPIPAAAALAGTLLYPQPRPIPPFALDASDASTFDNARIKGRWNLVFIGFTHCPDVCPTTLQVLAQAVAPWKDLDPAQRPQVWFVSVDPERDSVEKATEYARFFSPAILAATAPHERLQPFTRNLGMVYMQTPVEGGDYTVDHSSSVAIINPAGELVGVMRPPLQPGTISADLRELMKAAP